MKDGIWREAVLRCLECACLLLMLSAVTTVQPGTTPTTEKKPEPTADRETQQMPATEPEPSASSFPETKPAFLSDQVYELGFTSVPVGVLVELDDEVRRYHHPPASELSISKSGWIDFLMTSCAQDFPPPLVPSGPKYSSSPLVLPSFKSSTTPLVLPRSKQSL